MGSIYEFVVIPPSEAVSKSFVFLPEIGKFVSSSIWDNSFHIFRADPASVAHQASVRQKFSLLSTLTHAGGSLVLASWRDSSLTLWDLAEIRPQTPLYRRTPHLTSLVDVDASPRLGLIASLDKTRKCIFSWLETGLFVREFKVDGEDNLEKLALFTGGYCAVLGRTEGGSVIRVYGLNARTIGEAEFPEFAGESCKLEFETAVSALAVAFDGGKLRILRLPDLLVLTELQYREEIQALAFSVHANCLAVAGKTELALVHFDST
jgi:hypothetical protein